MYLFKEVIIGLKALWSVSSVCLLHGTEDTFANRACVKIMVLLSVTRAHFAGGRRIMEEVQSASSPLGCTRLP